tara:strand:+ start:297 stop:707 length:411 start_codon:yes stop_codon:yes gene_type:complete
MKTKTKNKRRKMKKALSYSEFHWADKSVDILLVIAVLSGIALLFVELVLSPGQKITGFIYMADIAILGIFFVDSTRTFLKSKNILEYLSHHKLDLVILTVMIVFFSSVAFLGISRISWLAREGSFLGKASKAFRVI